MLTRTATTSSAHRPSGAGELEIGSAAEQTTSTRTATVDGIQHLFALAEITPLGAARVGSGRRR